MTGTAPQNRVDGRIAEALAQQQARKQRRAEMVSGLWARRGWFRVGRTGWGISWRPASDGLIFSERYGYAHTLRIGGMRLRVLRPAR